MSKAERSSVTQIFLGIEAGATRTIAAAMNRQEGARIRREFGPANLRLVGDRELVRHFRAIARAMPQPVAVAIGMAGARAEPDRERIRKAADKVWRGVPCYATNDLETALA